MKQNIAIGYLLLRRPHVHEARRLIPLTMTLSGSLWGSAS